MKRLKIKLNKKNIKGEDVEYLMERILEKYYLNADDPEENEEFNRGWDFAFDVISQVVENWAHEKFIKTDFNSVNWINDRNK